jgi:hypothetical protein
LRCSEQEGFFSKMKFAERIQIIEGDLTEMDVDAIVNAANNDFSLAAVSPAQSGERAVRRSRKNATKSAKFPWAERPSPPAAN